MKHKLTRMTSLLLAFIMAFSVLLVPAAAVSFTDVRDNAWYKAAVDYVYEKGWMRGVSETQFAPDADVTRAMFVLILARMAEAELDNDAPAFTDTKAGKWYTGAAAWAHRNGIVAGIGDGKFAPARSILRQDLCVMLNKYLQFTACELTPTQDRGFTDWQSVSGYAREAVAYCASVGLVSGFQDGTFRPKATATRAEVAQIVMRLNMLLDGQTPPTDPMPAQSLSGDCGDGTRVSVDAPKGALPAGTELTASRVTDEDLLASIQSQVDGEILVATDITFINNDKEIEPEEEVQVRVFAEELRGLSGVNVYHVTADGTVEPVSAQLVSATRSSADKEVCFSARDFSIYVFTDGQAEAPFVTVHFRSSDWESGDPDIGTQKVLKSKINDHSFTGNLVYDPGVTDIAENLFFDGWRRGNVNGVNSSDNTRVTVETISSDLRANANVSDLYYYASVYPIAWVYYYNQYGVVTYMDRIPFTPDNIVSGTGKVQTTISRSYKPANPQEHFTGDWVIYDKNLIKPASPSVNNLPTYDELYMRQDPSPIIHCGDESTVELAQGEILHLFPVIDKGYWIFFENNIDAVQAHLGFADDSKAEYMEPLFVPSGKELTVNDLPYGDYFGEGTCHYDGQMPERVGYNFAGWYTESDLWDGGGNPDSSKAFLANGSSTFTNSGNNDIHLYANWSPGTAGYYVVYLQQKVTDDKNASDAAKTYDYFATISKEPVPTGTRLQVGADDRDFHVAEIAATPAGQEATDNSFYFQRNETRSSKDDEVIVRGDGTTSFINCFDRKLITLICLKSRMIGTTSNSDFLIKRDNYTSGPIDPNAFYGFRSDWSSGKPTPVIYREGSVFQDAGGLDRGSSGSRQLNLSRVGSSNYYTYTGLYGQTVTIDTPPNGQRWHGWFWDSDVQWYKIMLPNFEIGEGSYDYRVNLGQINGLPHDRTTFYYWLENVTDLQIKFYSYDHIMDLDGHYPAAPEMVDGSYVGVPHERNRTWNFQRANDKYRSPIDMSRLYWSTASGDKYQYVLSYEEAGVTTTTRKHKDVTVMETVTIAPNTAYIVHIYYERYKYNLQYVANYNAFIHSPAPIYYEMPLTGYGSYVPPAEDTPPGKYLGGWYWDDGSFTTPFEFASQTMPARDLPLYAKWNPIKYRVNLNFWNGVPDNENLSTSEAELGTSFLLDYEETLREDRVPVVERDGYVLEGWYTDPECTHSFNIFETGMYDGIHGMDTAYRNRADLSYYNDLTDRYHTGTALGTDAGNSDVRRELTLYANWIKEENYYQGLMVHYLSDENETFTGYFYADNRNLRDRTDSVVYPDTARLIVGAASKADKPSFYRFRNWTLLDKYGEPTAYNFLPGEELQLDRAYARDPIASEEEPEAPDVHTHQLTGAPTTAVTAATCTTPMLDVGAQYCSACGHYFKNNGNGVYVSAEIGAPAGHDYSTEREHIWRNDGRPRASCEIEVLKVKCNNCPDHYYSVRYPSEPHTKPASGVTVIPGTCIQPEETRYTCTACGKSVVEEGSLGNHDYAPMYEWASGEEGKTVPAENAEVNPRDVPATVTCTASSVCTVCGEEEPSVDSVPVTTVCQTSGSNAWYTATFTSPFETQTRRFTLSGLVVNFHVASFDTPVASMTIPVGGSDTLPSHSFSNAGYTFLGWVTQAYEERTSQISPEYSNGATVRANSAGTLELYALYSRAEGSKTASSIENSSITASSKYLIVSANTAGTNTKILAVSGSNLTVKNLSEYWDSNNSTLKSSTEDVEFTATQYATFHYLQTGNNQYLTLKTGVGLTPTAPAGYGAFENSALGVKNSNGTGLRFNSVNGSFISGSTGNRVYLWKVTGSTTYYYGTYGGTPAAASLAEATTSLQSFPAEDRAASRVVEFNVGLDSEHRSHELAFARPKHSVASVPVRSAGDALEYKLITSEPEAGKKYLIGVKYSGQYYVMSNNYFFASHSLASVPVTTVTRTEDGVKNTYISSSDCKDYEFSVSASGGNWTFKSAEDKYLALNGSGQLVLQDETTNAAWRFEQSKPTKPFDLMLNVGRNSYLDADDNFFSGGSGTQKAKITLFERASDPQKHTLTINYVGILDEDHPDVETVVHAPYSTELTEGEQICYVSPKVTGMTPDREIITMQMPDHDVEVKVTYSYNPLLKKEDDIWVEASEADIRAGGSFLIAAQLRETSAVVHDSDGDSYSLNGKYVLLTSHASYHRFLSYDGITTDEYRRVVYRDAQGYGEGEDPRALYGGWAVLADDVTRYGKYLTQAQFLYSNTGTGDGLEIPADLKYCVWKIPAHGAGQSFAIQSAIKPSYSLTAHNGGVFATNSGETTWNYNYATGVLSTSLGNSTKYLYATLFPTDADVTLGTFFTDQEHATIPDLEITFNPNRPEDSPFVSKVRFYKRLEQTKSTGWSVIAVDDEDGEEELLDSKIVENETPFAGLFDSPVKEGKTFVGWTFYDGTPVPADFTVTENVIVKASYTQNEVAENVQVIYLRANYDPDYNDRTHIYWYSNTNDRNNGDGSLMDDSNVPVDSPVTVPKPTLPAPDPDDSYEYPSIDSEERYFYQTDNDLETGAEREIGLSHPDKSRFLGWALVDQDASHADSDLRPWLVWDQETQKFYRSDDPTHAEVTRIAADSIEGNQVFIAVWQPVFYVFHSSTGEIVAYDLAKVTEGGGTFNLVDHVEPGYLYGGYYKSYGYLPAYVTEKVIEGYYKNANFLVYTKDGTQVCWTVGADFDDVDSSVVLGKLTIDNEMVEALDTLGQAPALFDTYRGHYLYPGQEKAYTLDETGAYHALPKIWPSADAYRTQANSGLTLNPKAGTVYYLKEVPGYYLSSKLLFSYDARKTFNNSNSPFYMKFNDIVIVSVTDDNNYTSVDFQVDGESLLPDMACADYQTPEIFAKSITFKTDSGSATRVDASMFFGSDCMHATSSYLMATRAKSFIDTKYYDEATSKPSGSASGTLKSFVMCPSWLTYDCVRVQGNPMRWDDANLDPFDDKYANDSAANLAKLVLNQQRAMLEGQHLYCANSGDLELQGAAGANSFELKAPVHVPSKGGLVYSYEVLSSGWVDGNLSLGSGDSIEIPAYGDYVVLDGTQHFDFLATKHSGG